VKPRPSINIKYVFLLFFSDDVSKLLFSKRISDEFCKRANVDAGCFDDAGVILPLSGRMFCCFSSEVLYEKLAQKHFLCVDLRDLKEKCSKMKERFSKMSGEELLRNLADFDPPGMRN